MTGAQIKTQKNYLEIIRELYNFPEYLMKCKEKTKHKIKLMYNKNASVCLFCHTQSPGAAVCLKHLIANFFV